MFVTRDGKESFVKYGPTWDKLDSVVATEVARYEREDMCDAPANDSVGWRDPGFIHDGVMLDLKDGKRYYYQVIKSFCCFVFEEIWSYDAYQVVYSFCFLIYVHKDSG